MVVMCAVKEHSERQSWGLELLTLKAEPRSLLSHLIFLLVGGEWEGLDSLAQLWKEHLTLT